MANFNPLLNTDKKFLAERYGRELMNDNLAWSTENMSNEDLRMAIIADLISFGVWNQEKKTKLNITFAELTRFVTPSDVDRIREQIDHEEIKHLIILTDGIYSLKEGREVYQAAMDYCGIWYEGYKAPDDFGVISVNHEVINDAVNEFGSIENLAVALAMDLNCHVPISNTLN